MSGMIVAPQPDAVEEGAKVLAKGGNAFDAALACAFVQFVVDPHSCGVGGYLLLNCWPSKKGQSQAVLDAPALAGSKVRPEMWEDEVIEPNPGGWGFFLKDRINEDGYLSICIPGTVRGLEAIHARWCSWRWADLVMPAIRLSEEGWLVGAHLAGRWKDKPLYFEGSSLFEKLHVTPEVRRIYLKPNGTAYDAGERIRNPDYGQTLQHLAEDGPNDFYEGKLAADIITDLVAHGSWVTAEDFFEYKIREEAPVIVQYRDYMIQTASAPHGGPTLAATLNILEGYDLTRLGHNSPAYISLVSMAMKAAFADRNRYLGDPRFVDVPLEWMISKERAQQWREAIDAGRNIDTGQVSIGSADTTQVSVVDRWGNCVSLTHSLGSSSGVITPGLGFMYNNSMINFHPFSGHPNSILARKARTTGMSPTVIFRGGKPKLILGAPGATRIITALLTVILNRLDFGMPITEAVLAPSFDCQGETITCHARIPESVCAQVRMKYNIVRLPQSQGGLALVHAIDIDADTGRLSGVADPGGDGMALHVEDS